MRDRDPGWEDKRPFSLARPHAGHARDPHRAGCLATRAWWSLPSAGRRQQRTLTEGLAWIEPPSGDLLALDEAIQQLKAEDADLAEIVQLRYYTGLSLEETADVVGVSVSTLKRDWRYARAWLARRLGDGTAG